MERTEAQRELYQGFGDTMTRAIELVVSPFLFALLGLLLDHIFGTGHLLALVFGVIGFIGGILRAYFAYRYEMTLAEQGKPWTRP